jgi:hypothetical protein
MEIWANTQGKAETELERLGGSCGFIGHAVYMG